MCRTIAVLFMLKIKMEKSHYVASFNLKNIIYIFAKSNLMLYNRRAALITQATICSKISRYKT